MLSEIFDKTTHIRGGLAANDIDIVAGALDERGELIGAYIRSDFGPPAGECARVIAKISELDFENNRALKAMMDECGDKLKEARRKIKELQVGKKAAGQYQGGASGGNRGAVFDLER
jgi:CTP:molybdopterin cytidylyltransferase MocA